MTEIDSGELSRDTAGVLRRVTSGEDVVITVKGRGVARFVPMQPVRRRWLGRDELARRLAVARSDPALRDELAVLTGDS